MAEQIKREKQYWIHAVIKTLTERGFAFPSQPIKHYGNKAAGSTSYLSKRICDELIDIMANKVRDSIFEDMPKAGYFSISEDSTPDLSHLDQLTVIQRSVSPDDGRFLTFLELEDHTGVNMANMIVNYLTEKGIAFSKCRNTASYIVN